MLTMPPGPDIAPYHDRQIAILDRADWAAWLDPLGLSQGDPEAAAGGQPRRRTGGLNASVAPFRVGAHEQKNEPAGGSRQVRSSLKFPLEFGCVGRSEGGSVRYIRSAILKTSQPRPAKLKPQRTITTIIALTSTFYRMITILPRESKSQIVKGQFAL